MSQDPQRDSWIAALSRGFIRPLTRLLLEVGIGAGDVGKLTETEFVRSAVQKGVDTGDRDPRNVARIAVETGVPRASVMALLDPPVEEEFRLTSGSNRSVRVLEGWCTNDEYLDRSGLPAVLPLNGPSCSFDSLVKRYGGDAALKQPILRDLVRVHAVRRVAHRHVQVIRRTYSPLPVNVERIAEFGEEAGELLQVLLNEFLGPAPATFHRRVRSLRIDHEHAAVLLRDFGRQGTAMFDAFANALSHPSMQAPPGARMGDRVSAAIYILGEPVPDTSASPPSRKQRKSKRRSRGRSTGRGAE